MKIAPKSMLRDDELATGALSFTCGSSYLIAPTVCSSVYLEILMRRGYGFHHIGIAIAAAQMAAEQATYEASGFGVAFSATVGSGGRVLSMDAGRSEPSFIELIPATPQMDESFTRMFRAAQNWRGEDPIRGFG